MSASHAGGSVASLQAPGLEDPIRAVVFDCDGTLVDTEPLAWSVLAEVLAAHGRVGSEADRLACIGRSEADSYHYLSTHSALPPAPEFWARCRHAMAERLAVQGVPVFPDVRETLVALRAGGVTMAVASSSSGARLRRVLSTADLAPFFDVVVCADDVARGKPAPDLFLLAAARLGLAPSMCLAVEDSLPGVSAARAAGMPVVHIARGATAIPGATVLPTTAGLLALLDREADAA